MKPMIPCMVWRVRAGCTAQVLEDPGRKGTQGGRNRSAICPNHNSRSVKGAYTACFGEPLGYERAIAPLQALDVRKPCGERPEVCVFVEESRDGFGGHGNAGGEAVHIILGTDSLAKSGPVTRSQSHVAFFALC